MMECHPISRFAYVHDLVVSTLYGYVANDPISWSDQLGLREVTVAFWDKKFPYVAGTGSVGHVAVLENNGKVILSQFPSPHGSHEPNSQKTYKETIAAEGGRRPDHIFKVFVPNDRPFDVAAKDHATRKWWDKVASNNDETNCSMAAQGALDQGGLPLDNNYVVTTPSDLLDTLTRLSEQKKQGPGWYVKKIK